MSKVQQIHASQKHKPGVGSTSLVQRTILKKHWTYFPFTQLVFYKQKKGSSTNEQNSTPSKLSSSEIIAFLVIREEIVARIF